VTAALPATIASYLALTAGRLATTATLPGGDRRTAGDDRQRHGKALSSLPGYRHGSEPPRKKKIRGSQMVDFSVLGVLG
jgi:hypothetical protein